MTTLDWALEHGKTWRIFPVLPDNRKVPLNGFPWLAEATQDPQVITSWFGPDGKYQNYMIGGVTGPVEHGGTGYLVVDVDVKNGAVGDQSWANLEEVYGPFDITRSHVTGSGGWHFIYQYPGIDDDFRNIQQAKGELANIDVRGYHGFVVLPGSRYVDKDGPHTWSIGEDAGIEELPVRLADVLRRKPRPAAVAPAATAEAKVAVGDTVFGFELEALCIQVRDCGPGQKHQALYDASLKMAGWFRPESEEADRGLAGFALLEAVKQAALRHGDLGFDEGKAIGTINDGFANGSGIKKVGPGGTFIGNIADYNLALPPVAQWERRSLDDFGNADRLADHYGDRLKWTTDSEQWVWYQDTGWALVGAGTMVWGAAKAAIEAAQRLEADSWDDTPGSAATRAEPDRTERDLFRKWMGQSRSRTRVAAMIEIAKAEPSMYVQMADFDSNPMLLGLANGVVDLSTGMLLPHSPDLLVMQRSPVAFDPGASCPLWDKFLGEMQPDPVMREFLQRAIGYSMTGSIAEQAMFIHVGGGDNGKSVFMDVLAKLLGQYAQTVPSATLLDRKGEMVPNDIARMRGKRLLRASETERGKHLAESLVKELTGGEQVSARHMRAEFFDFTPTGKIHLTTNHLPFTSGSYSMERRIKRIDWAVTIDKHRKDLRLTEKLLIELPGIFNWALVGVRSWLEQGLATPESVVEATREYMQLGDALAQWIDQRLEPTPDAEAETILLYDDYREFAIRTGEKPMTMKSFSQGMQERGYKNFRSSDKHRKSMFADVALRIRLLRPANTDFERAFDRRNG